MKMKPATRLLKRYRYRGMLTHIQQAYTHRLGQWYWTLTRFPGAYFDQDGVLEFMDEREFCRCLYLNRSGINTSVRHGLSISDISGYRKLTPSPYDLSK